MTEDGSSLSVDLRPLVSDVETTDANLSYVIVAGPALAEGVLVASAPNGVFAFTPAAEFNGSSSFTFRVVDRGDPDNCGVVGPGCTAAETSVTRTFTITVDPDNDIPVAAAGSTSMAEDGAPIAIDLSALVSDVETTDANLSYQVVAGPAPAAGALVASAPNGTFTFTPAADFNGTASFTYNVSDRGDPDNCGVVGPGCTAAETSMTRTFTITVDPGNDSPAASDGSGSMAEDGPPLAVDLRPLVADIETIDANLDYQIVAGPAPAEGAAGRLCSERNLHVHACGQLQRDEPRSPTTSAIVVTRTTAAPPARAVTEPRPPRRGRSRSMSPRPTTRP